VCACVLQGALIVSVVMRTCYASVASARAELQDLAQRRYHPLMAAMELPSGRDWSFAAAEPEVVYRSAPRTEYSHSWPWGDEGVCEGYAPQRRCVRL
jgi:hypothetical protein